MTTGGNEKYLIYIRKKYDLIYYSKGVFKRNVFPSKIYNCPYEIVMSISKEIDKIKFPLKRDYRYFSRDHVSSWKHR